MKRAGHAPRQLSTPSPPVKPKPAAPIPLTRFGDISPHVEAIADDLGGR